MVFLLSRNRSTRFVMVCILTMVMVFAHWQGLSHRISHASQYPYAGSSLAANTPASPHQQALQHSCLAYDAATPDLYRRHFAGRRGTGTLGCVRFLGRTFHAVLFLPGSTFRLTVLTS